MGRFGQTIKVYTSTQPLTADVDERVINRLSTVIALSGLFAALASLPLPTHGSSPDVSAILAIISVAVLAGHRWALPLLCVLSGAMMLVWTPILAAAKPASTLEYGCLLSTCILAVPGIWTSLRVGPMLGELLGLGDIFRRTTHMLAPVAMVVLAMAIGVM